MSKKNKILIIFVILLFVVFIIGATYSYFVSNANLGSDNTNIAKFIFNAEALEEIELPLIDLKPGDIEEYNFLVTNSNLEDISDVVVEYELTIKTYHFIPFLIELYKVEGEVDTLLVTCDETYSRNLNNELVCNSLTQELNNELEEEHSYKLVIEFPSEYNDEKYSDLVDFISLEIKSWQKL